MITKLKFYFTAQKLQDTVVQLLFIKIYFEIGRKFVNQRLIDLIKMTYPAEKQQTEQNLPKYDLH